MNTTREVKAPLRYFGSKWRLADWIVDQLPPHTCYVEPFGGSAAVLLTKEPSEHEVYNDVDGDLVRFFRILRERTCELAGAIARTPYSREEHLLSFETCEDDLERARRFAVRSWQTRGGVKRASQGRGWRYSIASSNWSSPATVWSKVPERVIAAADRLKKVYIEHDDWRNVVERFDAPTTLHYWDPPYVIGERTRVRKTYVHEFTDADHEDLLSIALEVEGMVAISGFPSDIYDDALQGWERLEVAGQAMSNAATTEVLWLSPSAVRQPRQAGLQL